MIHSVAAICSSVLNSERTKLTVFHVFFSLLLVSSNGASASAGPENLVTVRDDFVRTAGYGEEKLSSVLVTGSLLCHPCFHLGGAVQTYPWHVAGASVAITCKIGRKRRKMNWAVGTTDEYGVFIIDLPSHLHAIQKLDKACMVRVLRQPKNSACWRVKVPQKRSDYQRSKTALEFIPPGL